ncbi:MAG: TrbG/VirB9 family P-type conjugative transfer protein [Rickettsiales bacterium]|jgi:ComB9 competence protein|nr:TrbG/VirB9 family P-type conjugative transfer protein [Rickettsiales bacterium]
MRKTIAIVICLALGFARGADAQDVPNPGVGFGTQSAWDNPMQNMGEGQSRPGYQKIQWEPGSVMPVKLRDGMLTVINFPEWETIKDAYVGDKDFFDGRPVEKNTFMISPVDGRAMADTNLFIFGNSGNKYVFYLKSEPLNSEKVTASVVDVSVPVRYRKGGGAGAAAAGGGGNFASMKSIMGGQSYRETGDNDWEGEDFGWIKSINVDPTEFRFDLDVFVPNPDDYVIAPERVWRDQVFTYIDFGEKALNMNQRPVVSLLVEGGETPVGFRTEGPQSRLIVVEAIGDLVLRNGQRIVCIKLRSKPYLLSNPPPPQDLIAVSGSAGATAAGAAAPQYGNAQMMQAPYAGYDTLNTGAYGYPQAVDPSMGYHGGYGMGGSYSPEENEAMYNALLPKGRTNASVLPNHYVPLVKQSSMNVSVEIYKGKSVVELENKWLALTEQFPWLDEYTPFYSVETSGVDEIGLQRYYGGEFYRLRIGPFNQIDVANEICQKLSLHNEPCSVVRTQ